MFVPVCVIAIILRARDYITRPHGGCKKCSCHNMTEYYSLCQRVLVVPLSSSLYSSGVIQGGYLQKVLQRSSKGLT